MNLSRWSLPLTFLAALSVVPGAVAAQSQAVSSKPKPPQPGDEIIVPASTQIPLELRSDISSRTASMPASRFTAARYFRLRLAIEL